MNNLNHSADQANRSISTVTEEIQTLTRSHDETHAKLDQMSELQQAQEQARQAMVLVLEEKVRTSECKSKNCVHQKMKRKADPWRDEEK